MKKKAKASHPSCRPGFVWSTSQRRCIRSRSKDSGSGKAGLIRRRLPSAIIKKLAALPESGMGFQLVVLVMKNGKHLSHVKVLNGSIALIPKGLNINEVIGIRLAKGKKKTQQDPTAFGIIMGRDNINSILKMGSGIVHWPSSAGIEALAREAHGKPCYKSGHSYLHRMPAAEL